jgi:hypothetical protein
MYSDMIADDGMCQGVGISNGTSTATTSSSTSRSTSSSSTTSLPYPTQSGIVTSCNNFAEAVSGDYCSKFASDHGITTAQLYAWNPILGSTGQNCNTEFFAGYDYCVRAPPNIDICISRLRANMSIGRCSFVGYYYDQDLIIECF